MRTASFAIFLCLPGRQWRLARVLSYDHQLAEPSGERK